MPSLLFYILKLSVALAVVYLFYHLVLRRLTFYNWNRWYFIIYTAIAFLIPFIDITPVLERNEWTDNRIIGWVPALNENSQLENTTGDETILSYFTSNASMIILITGMLFLFARLIIQLISFNRMKKKAIQFSENGLTIYQVNENIIPFSFGNSIFINRQLHSEDELREIIRHEFVHVKQKHSIDIIWSELLCLFNWYNPFAWLLRRSIRQNLEFIADNKVIENGINKKEYQYLLLKVIGNSQFSIATQFNFSSLKKRIAMMNKTKSAKRQLGRFLFLVPVLAIILLSFRKSFTDVSTVNMNADSRVLRDTIPDVKILNSKGYYIDIKDDKGNCTVVVKDKDKKEVKRLLLTEWNEKDDYYENLYGEILSPTTAIVEEKIKANNPAITAVTVKGNTATVTLKNGKREVYTLSIKDQKKAFEVRCGIREVAIAPTETLTEVRVTTAELAAVPVEERISTTVAEPVEVTVATIADDFEINDNKAVMKLRNGKVEEFNLADPKEKAAFEKKFGKIIKAAPVTTTTGVYSIVSAAGEARPTVVTTLPASLSKEVEVINEEVALVTTKADEISLAEMETILTITQKTTKEQLELFKSTLKTKGFELSFDETEYKNGLLVKISGTIKSKDGQANFAGVDFNKIIVSQVKKGEKTYFRIDEVAKKKVVS